MTTVSQMIGLVLIFFIFIINAPAIILKMMFYKGHTPFWFNAFLIGSSWYLIWKAYEYLA